MKKILSLTLIIVLAVSLVACTQVKEEAEDLMPDVMDDGTNSNTDTNNNNNDTGIMTDTPTGSITMGEFLVEDYMPCVSEYSKYSDTCYGFGFKKTDKGKTPSIGSYQKLLEGTNSVYIGNTDLKNIYLTFDEGYENGYTAGILDVLKEKNVPAAFFCTGDYLKRNTELVQRMIDEGHIVGNHTWNHKSMPSVLSDVEFSEELRKIDEFMLSNFKIQTKYFRYPNGEFSEKSLNRVKDMGYKTVFWSLAFKDWEKDVIKGATYSKDEVCNHIHNGAIILLHAVSKDNLEALPSIIDTLNEEGYVFSNLDNLKF